MKRGRAPEAPLDGCDQHHECTTCPLQVCAYPRPVDERRFRRRRQAARELLGGGCTAAFVARVTGFDVAYVAAIAAASGPEVR